MKVGFQEFVDRFVDGLFAEVVLDKAKKFYEMMARLEFLPNTPTLMNAGTEKPLMSGCFVLPVEDNLESIFKTVRDAAFVHKAGGGTGFAFSHIRPRGDTVSGKPRAASGPVSFMKVFNSATNEIKQGFSRRGANMGVLSVHHPDIMEFIDSKIPPEGSVYVRPDDMPFSNFNISVAVTERFMRAVQEDDSYELVNPRNGNVTGRLPAKDVWERMIRNAWINGDPGMIFIDTMNEHNPTPSIGTYESTNPCGEQVLLPYESCNLGAINLTKMITDDEFDLDRYVATVRAATDFLNDVLDMNWYPLPEIEKMTRENRKIGLGVMGFADALAIQGIPYDSPEEGFSFAGEVAGELMSRSHERSIELSRLCGPFLNFPGSKWQSKCSGIFNASTTTIAPTGTTGILANSVSAGIEPLFHLAYTRRTFEGHSISTVNKVFVEALLRGGLYDERIIDYAREHGSVQDFDPSEVFRNSEKCRAFNELKKVFKVAYDIDYRDHVMMQAVFQKFIDSSISKTINFPSDATEDDVAEAVLMAYHNGCKGITVYRDGSRDWQVIDVVKKEQKLPVAQPSKLPTVMPSQRIAVNTGCGSKIYVFVVTHPDTGKPVEVFVEMGKSGGCVSAWAHGTGRLVSRMLQYGIPPEEIIKQLSNIQCNSPLSAALSPRHEKVSSCLDAIAKALADHSRMNGGSVENRTKDRQHRRECPKCGSDALTFSEGCVKCSSCNYSKCE
jgi:ribonucleoside-diphosphate reductase alpha chain